jgi:UDP-galactose transporter B1
MVPVMLMGTLLHGKRYSGLEYACMSMIGAGISLFARKSSSKVQLVECVLCASTLSHAPDPGLAALLTTFSPCAVLQVTSKLAAPNAPLGYFLCFVNLTFDGYTNAFQVCLCTRVVGAAARQAVHRRLFSPPLKNTQDEINRSYPHNDPIHMMCWMNFWGALFYGAYMAVSGIGGRLLLFCVAHTAAAWDVGVFCLCGAVGQLFIFFTIKHFGSLVNTLICTTRKFFNILGSVLLNGNPLLPAQWWAVGLVFTGLLTSSVTKAKTGGGHHGATATAGGGAGKRA